MKKKIGQLIKERLEASPMKVTAFAKAIGTERTNVYDILKRDSIDTGLLKKIGQVLDYDFFQHMLEDRTIEAMRNRHIVKTARILVEIELSEDEITNIKLDEKIFKILNK